MDLQVGVKVYLRNAEGKFLLLQRSLTKYPEVPNRWDIIGGRIDIGTPLLTNLDRELLEETGMKMSTAPKLIAAQDILRIPGRHVVRLTYIAQTNDARPTLSDEHDDFGWFTVAEMQIMDGFDMYAKEILPLVS
jgi:8-oxo-dGTP pyrophosphatase MutT (NUDIX family)